MKIVLKLIATLILIIAGWFCGTGVVSLLNTDNDAVVVLGILGGFCSALFLPMLMYWTWETQIKEILDI